MIPAMPDLRLNVKRQTGVIDKPLDQAMAHGGAGRPDAGWNVRRVAQQANRAFPDHLRGRAVTGVAIATDRDANLTSIRGEPDEQKIVKARLLLLFRRALARLRSARSAHFRVGGND